MVDRSTATLNLAGSTSTEAGLTKYGRNERTILIIEDESYLRDIMKQYLSLLGYNVLTAQDGQNGLDIFGRSSTEIDLVMLDLNLPFMTGEEVLSRLIEMRPDVKVVISSGTAVQDISDNVIVNASCCLKKPFRMADLADVLRNVIGA